MAKGTEELACTIKECYPMIVFFICVVCGLCGNIVNIIKEFSSSDSMEEKFSKSGATVMSYLCGFISCTIPIFFIIKSQCVKFPRNCNPGWGWFTLIAPSLFICICIIASITLGVYEFGSGSNEINEDE